LSPMEMCRALLWLLQLRLPTTPLPAWLIRRTIPSAGLPSSATLHRHGNRFMFLNRLIGFPILMAIEARSMCETAPHSVAHRFQRVFRGQAAKDVARTHEYHGWHRGHRLVEPKITEGVGTFTPPPIPIMKPRPTAFACDPPRTALARCWTLHDQPRLCAGVRVPLARMHSAQGGHGSRWTFALADLS
jgi:hypothetical protein